MTSDISHRIVFFVILALACLGTFVFSRDRIRSGFVLFICTLGLGWRTFPVTQVLRIHPAEVVLWILFLCWLGQPRHRPQSKNMNERLPVWLWVLIPFWILAWLPMAGNPYSWDVQLSEFRNFLLLIPVFIVTGAVLTKKGSWRSVVLGFYCVGLWIAGMGVVEYIFPGIATLLPGFVSDASAIVTVDRFARASFSFYGNALAICVCALALPMGIVIWRLCPTAYLRGLTLVGAVLQVAAIYVSGSRLIWLLTGVQVLCFAVRAKGYLLGALVLLLALAGYQALPGAAQTRLDSLGMILEGRPIDSSGVDRWERVTRAFNEILQWPFGYGWSAAGWVHSDFLQVTANLGIIAGLIFAGAYATTLCRLWSRTHSSGLNEEASVMGLALFLSFLAAGAILAFECMVVLPQTALPIWLVWALAEIWLRQTSPSSYKRAKGNRVWNSGNYRASPRSRAGIRVPVGS